MGHEEQAQVLSNSAGVSWKKKKKKINTFSFWMLSQYVWILRSHPICLPLPEALLTMLGCHSILKPFSSHLGSAPRLMGYHGCLVQKPRHLTASELNCWGVEGEKRAFKQTNTSFVVKAIINFKILWSFHISKTNLDISNLKEWFFSIYLSIYVFI